MLEYQHNFHTYEIYRSTRTIITQDLKATTAMSVAVRNKRHTFENIVNKTKIKMGKLNYSIHLRRTATNDLRKPISHCGFEY